MIENGSSNFIRFMVCLLSFGSLLMFFLSFQLSRRTNLSYAQVFGWSSAREPGCFWSLPSGAFPELDEIFSLVQFHLSDANYYSSSFFQDLYTNPVLCRIRSRLQQEETLPMKDLNEFFSYDAKSCSARHAWDVEVEESRKVEKLDQDSFIIFNPEEKKGGGLIPKRLKIGRFHTTFPDTLLGIVQAQLRKLEVRMGLHQEDNTSLCTPDTRLFFLPPGGFIPWSSGLAFEQGWKLVFFLIRPCVPTYHHSFLNVRDHHAGLTCFSYQHPFDHSIRKHRCDHLSMGLFKPIHPLKHKRAKNISPLQSLFWFNIQSGIMQETICWFVTCPPSVAQRLSHFGSCV